jgi:cyclophilin family peptidyl-prolyl cis-trans isomerase
VVELYPDKAPNTVENFLGYVRDGHYNGTIFHRVINNFMIQGGGYDARYMEKPTRPPIKHEGAEVESQRGPTNTVGTIAMARTNNPHSASSQFFINVNNNDFLNSHGPLDRVGVMWPLAKWSVAWKWLTKSNSPPPVREVLSLPMFRQTQVVIQSAASVK